MNPVHNAVAVFHLNEHENLALSGVSGDFGAVNLYFDARAQTLMIAEAGGEDARRPSQSRLPMLVKELIEGDVGEDGIVGGRCAGGGEHHKTQSSQSPAAHNTPIFSLKRVDRTIR